MAEEIYPELSDDGEAIGRNRDAIKLRLEWLVDQTWRTHEDDDMTRATEFVEHCDVVARAADGAASVLQPGVYAHTAFSDIRDYAQQASYQFACVDGTDADAAKAYMRAGWQECKNAFGALYGI